MDSSGRQYPDQVAYVGWNTSSHQPANQSAYQQQATMYYSQPQTQTQPAQAAFPQQPSAGPYSFPPPPLSGHHLQPQLLPLPPSTEASSELRQSASYETSVYIGLDEAPAEFRLAFRVIGEKGQNLEYLSRTTNARVILRGRGTGIVNNKPLHIFVGHATLEGKEEAESLANNLVRAVKEEYADWLKEKGYPKDKPAAPVIGEGVKPPTQNGAARPREMPRLRITRDPGGRVEVRHEDGGRPPPRHEEPRRTEIHLGRVEVRQEDSRRVVKIPRSEHSALDRLGPRVPVRYEQPGCSYNRQMGPLAGEHRRSRSRSPIARSEQQREMGSPPRRLEDLSNRLVHVRQGPGGAEDLRSKIQERSRDLSAREERMTKECLMITTRQDSRAVQTPIDEPPRHGHILPRPASRPPRPDDRPPRHHDKPPRHDERPPRHGDRPPSLDNRPPRPDDRLPRQNKWEPRRNEDRPDDRRLSGRDDRQNNGFKDRREERHDRWDERRDDGKEELNRPRPNAFRRARQEYIPGRRQPYTAMNKPPAKLHGGQFGMAAMAFVGTKKKDGGRPPFFVPGIRGEALKKFLEMQDYSKLTPIFVVRKGHDVVHNYIWVLGDTVAYLAAQRAADHPAGPNLEVPKTMILWFGYPGLSFKDVPTIVKEKLAMNLPPDAIILHVGGEDLVHYPGKETQLEEDMAVMVGNIKKLLPRTHISWSNILPWRKYPSEARSQAVYKSLRLQINLNAKCLMKDYKGSTLYHDNDFICSHGEPYHKKGFYPSEEGARCMVDNFASIIKDLVTQPSNR